MRFNVSLWLCALTICSLLTIQFTITGFFIYKWLYATTSISLPIQQTRTNTHTGQSAPFQKMVVKPWADWITEHHRGVVGPLRRPLTLVTPQQPWVSITTLASWSQFLKHSTAPSVYLSPSPDIPPCGKESGELVWSCLSIGMVFQIDLNMGGEKMLYRGGWKNERKKEMRGLDTIQSHFQLVLYITCGSRTIPCLLNHLS